MNDFDSKMQRLDALLSKHDPAWREKARVVASLIRIQEEVAHTYSTRRPANEPAWGLET